jgi:hypothetical protein
MSDHIPAFSISTDPFSSVGTIVRSSSVSIESECIADLTFLGGECACNSCKPRVKVYQGVHPPAADTSSTDAQEEAMEWLLPTLPDAEKAKDAKEVQLLLTDLRLVSFAPARNLYLVCCRQCACGGGEWT